MIVNEIGIANFKSFDSEGVKITLDKRINVFIGKNNSGKSNVLKFIKLLSDYYGNWNKWANTELENQFRRNGENPILIFSLNLSEIWKHHSHLFNKNEIYEFKFRMPDFKLVGQHPFFNFDNSILLSLQTHYSGAGNETLLEEINKILINHIKSNLELFKDLIYVPHFREVNDQKDVITKTFDGNKIISRLFEMQNPKIGDETNRQKFDKIQNFVRELLAEKTLRIEVPHTRDRIILEMNGNRLSLESYGTGVHELVILCSALTIFDNYVFCIEEPELHLHPELQRKFIDYIQSFNNYFFISTHSNVFIDYKPTVGVFHVVHDNISTKIYPCFTNQATYEILSDLAYKASDLLQCNGIIWVEGPSDKIYLNQWISLLDNSLIEGIHHSIMYYGGRLLSHLTLKEDNNELIKLLRINRNAIVMIDKDGISSETELNSTKKRIQKETDEENCWITAGREIENYLSENTMKQFLSKKIESPKFTIDLNKKLGESILVDNPNINLKYDVDKVKYAREIKDYITEADLGVLDLRERLNHLISQIRKWNNL